MKYVPIVILSVVLQLHVIGCGAVAKESNMPEPLTYQVVADGKVFSISSPSKPDKKFSKHRSSISLSDDELFATPGVGVSVLSLNWTYKDGFLFKTVSGVLDMDVAVFSAERNVSSKDQLEQEILDAVRSDPVVVKLGYTDKAISFREVDIGGFRWLTYAHPLGGLQYAAVLSEDRYLVANFDLINNSKDKSSTWKREAKELVTKLVASMRLEQAEI